MAGTSGPKPVLVMSRWPKVWIAAGAPNARLMTAALVAAGIGTLASAVHAQQPVTTFPLPATTSGANASSTVGVASTYQTVFPANTSRHGCMVQAVSGAPILLYEGAAASSLAYTNVSAKSLTLSSVAPAQIYSCGQWGTVLTGEIAVTASAAAAYYAVQW